jgi:hypothetical protein
MSNFVTSHCRLVRLPFVQKAVLMCIADYCHDDGQDWHSIPAIAAWTCLGRSTVIEALHALEVRGLLVIEKASGRNNRTTIQLDLIQATVHAQPAANQSASRTSPAPAPVQEPDGTGSAAGLPPVQEPDLPVRELDPKHQEASLKHQKQTQRIAKTGPTRSAPKSWGSANEPPGFATFFAAYPRKVARSDAAIAFGKLSVDDGLLRTMLVAIEGQSRTGDWLKNGGKYIPYPATWLNGKRWLDELPTAAARAYIGPMEGRSANGVVL